MHTNGPGTPAEGFAFRTFFRYLLSDLDIGNPSPRGSSTYEESTGTYTLTAGGGGIGGQADHFHYTYVPVVPVTGGSTPAAGQSAPSKNPLVVFPKIAIFVARLVSLRDTARRNLAGMMVRNDTDLDSPNAFFGVDGNEIVFKTRDLRGGPTTTRATMPVFVPVYLQLSHSENVLSAYCSPNGRTWIAIASVPWDQTVARIVGIALTSANAGVSNTVRFDSFKNVLGH